MLDGIRVLDLTRILAGPYCTMLLGDLGAEVIKIEPPEGDDTRRMGPPFVGGESAYFLCVNRNKKSVVLDLTKDASKLIDLAKTCDVMVDNYRPGVLAKLGIGHDVMRRANPKMVLCTITSFGEDGPMRDLPAFDLIIQAWAGAMSVTGEPGRPPVRLGIPLGDLAGGLHAALAVSAALVKRERTGIAERIELSLLDCLTSMMTYLVQYHFADGRVPGPQGSRHMTSVPYGAFKAGNGWIVVGVFTERFWTGFRRAMELSNDPGFSTNEKRLANRVELEAMLEGLFATRPVEEWLRRLQAEGIPCAPVLTVDRVVALEQLALRGLVGAYRHPTAGDVKTILNPITRRPVKPPPLLGEHTREFLR